jgi:hypothetical protein
MSGRWPGQFGPSGGPSADELLAMGVPKEVVEEMQRDGFPGPGQMRSGGFTFTRIKHADGRTETRVSHSPEGFHPEGFGPPDDYGPRESFGSEPTWGFKPPEPPPSA